MNKKYPEGLVHLWRLDGNLLDAVGGVNGSAEGTITYESGKFSICAKLINSANIRVDLSDTLSKYTIQAWVKCISVTAYSGILFSRVSSVETYGFYFNNDNTSIDLIATQSNSGQIGWYRGTPTNWQLYTFTSDGSNIKCYINGVQQSGKWSYGTADRFLKLRSNTRIGRDSYSSSRNLNGYIQQVMIFDRALSQSEINKYYNNGAGVEI